MNKQFFPQYNLPVALVSELRKQNPWWEGKPAPPQPRFRRWPFEKLLQRLSEPIAPILQLRGPRQTGKTTLQQQLIEHLLNNGVSPKRILRVQFDQLKTFAQVPEKDDPILRIADWFEHAILGQTFNEAIRAGEHAFLFFDEIQNVPNWAVQMKALVDRASVRALITGSSALRIAHGRDSIAGRIQSFEIGPLRLGEIAALRGFGTIAPFQTENNWGDWTRLEFWREFSDFANQHNVVIAQAFATFSERGGYPLAQAKSEVSWPEIADQLIETVIRRVIEHDRRVGERGRKRDKQLLEAVFRMACRYIGQAPNPATLAREVRDVFSGNIGPQRIRHYLDFLDSALLIRLIQPLEIRLKKRRGYAKFCLCDHALRAAWLQEVIPVDPTALDKQPHLHDLAGHVAESIIGYYFASLGGMDLAYLPERSGQPEVDFVLTIGEKRIPVEVRYRRTIDPLRETIGLRAFIERAVNNAPLGLLITRDEDTTVADPRIVCLSLRSLLMVR